MVHNLIIIGGGCAGYTCGIYAGRALLNPILFEGYEGGGQLAKTSDVENFPGYESINGYDLMEKMKDHAAKCGTNIISKPVTKVNLSVSPFLVYIDGNNVPLETKSIIIATGASARKVNMINLDTYWMKGGISACAVCDAALPIYRNKPSVVIGGGDSAMTEALYLCKYASKVYIIHRNQNFKASKIMLDRAKKNEKITFILDTIVIEAIGDNLLKQIRIKNTISDEEKLLDTSGLFFAVGHIPGTELFKNQLTLDPEDYILTKPGSTETSVSGVFACGDCVDKKYRQAITACGSGCAAALDCEKWLASQ